jgi:hypothetical protein
MNLRHRTRNAACSADQGMVDRNSQPQGAQTCFRRYSYGLLIIDFEGSFLILMDAFSDIKPVPPDVISSWPAPNTVDPERRGPALIIINSILLPLSLVVVGLRLYTRLRIARSAGLDDFFIALASVSPANPTTS